MFGKIKNKRLKMNISQQKLAKRAGVSQSVLSDIESGKTKNPELNTIKKLAKALNTTIDELLENEEDEMDKIA